MNIKETNNGENETGTLKASAKPSLQAKFVGMAMILFWGILAILLFYGIKHCAHVQNVKTALDFQCKKTVKDYAGIKSAEIPWWRAFNLNDDYPCSATLKIGSKEVPVSFVAKEVTLNDVLRDDWEVNFGIWGWIGDDYRIMDIKAK